MNKLLFLFLAVSCTQITTQKTDIFTANDLRGCFLLYNVKTAKLEEKLGTTCEIRYPASSTFKVPLSVMAFDAGVLKSEKDVLKWDGKKRWLDAWNQDQTPGTWMKYSVVWFSQRLTPELGEKRVQKYLTDFDYGNKNIHVGLTDAWLNSADKPDSALSLSAYEQLEFMKKFWTGALPVSQKSLEVTRKIMFLETLPSGFSLSGKTGSNFFDKEHRYQLGWFVAHFERGDEEYISVMNITDLKPYTGKDFGGMRAKELTKKMFEEGRGEQGPLK